MPSRVLFKSQNRLNNVNVLIKLTVVSLWLFYKTITKWFSVKDSVIYAPGMLLDFRKAVKQGLYKT